MTQLIDKRDSLSNLISPVRDIHRPIYNWHSFKHSYSKALVDTLISEFKLKKGAWVMDPFCGGGTTLLACKEHGINSQGFDILPFSVFLSNVKTRNYDIEQLTNIKSKFKLRQQITVDVPALTNIPIARKAFGIKVREELIKIKQWIEEINDPISRDFYNLAMLSILESVSKTSKAGGFLRLNQKRIRSDTVKEKYINRIDSMISDLHKSNGHNHKRTIHTLATCCDARQLETKKLYDAVITSPPYPNRHDYSRIYSLEMLFDFVENNDDLKSIRYNTLRSHVEARKRYQSTDYIKPKRLTELIRNIESNGTNNPMVTSMLEGYFEDMYLALHEISKRVRKNGKVALVVSNVRFAGVNIPVDEILSDVGKQAGLMPVAIWIARYRGNSSQQMKAYRRVPNRESLILWQK